MSDADTAENNPDAPQRLIVPVSCEMPNRVAGSPKLSGKACLQFPSGTMLHGIMANAEVREEMFCNYEVNPAYVPALEQAGLVFNAYGSEGQIRGAELPGHRFFLATLFQPQLSSTPDCPHPIVIAYLRAALNSA